MKYNELEAELYKATVLKENTHQGQQPVYISPFQHILNKIANNLMQQSDLIWGPCYGISPVDYNLMQPNQRHEIIETLINRHV